MDKVPWSAWSCFYPRLVRAFFVAVVVDSNNFTLKTTLKGTEILISKQLLTDLLGVPTDSSRIYDGWCEIMGLRKTKIIKIFLKDKDNDFKSTSLTSFGKIAHWIFIHYVQPWAGTYQEVNYHDFLVIYYLWRKIPLSLSHLIINQMIKETSGVPCRMLMTLVLRHFGVFLEDETKDDEVLTWGRRMLQLWSWTLILKWRRPRHVLMRKMLKIRKKEKKKKKKAKEKKEKKDNVSTKRSSPLFIELIRSGKRLKVRARISPQSNSEEVNEASEKDEEDKAIFLSCFCY